MKNDEYRKAVLYCRVSSKKQKQEGSGLDSQEHRCRLYAASSGYEVVDVYPDDVSGGGDFMNRKGMVALLQFLDDNPDENYVVIFDDLKRFARDTVFHLQLRQELAARNAKVECLNFKFEDTPEGEFIETIMAAQGQLERKQNGRQVRQKMQARLEAGYWVFQAPLAYKYIEDPDSSGKILVRDEPFASKVKAALEGFAHGTFRTITEVSRFLEEQDCFPSGKAGKKRHLPGVIKMLKNEIYAGYVRSDAWRVPVTKGKHEALVDMETYTKIQTNLEKRSFVTTRKDLKGDFPLRGAVSCACCSHPLTGAWSKGKYKSYAYYVCQQEGCEKRGKSIPRERMESDFRSLLAQLTPSGALIKTAAVMFKEWWEHYNSHALTRANNAKIEISKVDGKIRQTLQRILKSSSQTVISAFEEHIDKLEKDKLVLVEKTAKIDPPNHTYEKILELSLKFLANPLKLWDSGRLDLRRLLLKLAFAEHLEYCKETGYRTPKTTLPFKVLAGFGSQNEEMVPRRRLELPRP